MKQFYYSIFYCLWLGPMNVAAQNPNSVPVLQIEEQPVWNLNMVVEVKGEKADAIAAKLKSYINATGVLNGPMEVETIGNVRQLCFYGELYLKRSNKVNDNIWQGALNFSVLIQVKDEKYKMSYWNLCHNNLKVNAHKSILRGGNGLPVKDYGCFPNPERSTKDLFEKITMDAINEFTHNLNLQMTNPKSILNNNDF